MGAADSAGVWVYLQHPFYSSDSPNSESESHSVNSLWPHGLYSLWNSLGQNTAVDSLSLFQGIFPTQGSKSDLLHCGLILYQLSHKGSPQVIINFQVLDLMGFPGGTNGKEPTCQARRLKRRGFNHWVRKIPWRRAWEPTPVFLPWESHGQRSLVLHSGVTKNQTWLKQLSTHTHPWFNSEWSLLPQQSLSSLLNWLEPWCTCFCCCCVLFVNYVDQLYGSYAQWPIVNMHKARICGATRGHIMALAPWPTCCSPGITALKLLMMDS